MFVVSMLLFEKKVALLGITFVDESQIFDFEKSGKSFNGRKGEWSWLNEAEKRERVIE